MIVYGYSEMKRFLPAVNMKGEPDVFDDALEMAQESLVTGIIGTDLEAKLEERKAEDRRLFANCQRIISIEAFLKCVPEMDLVLTDSGFGVISNQDMAPASKERVQNLMAALQTRLDESMDRLVTFLAGSSQYEAWRGTEEYARLSDGLILTYAEFKDVAVLNPVTAPAYPHTWREFLELNPAMNVALTADVASYVSPEYVDEILEKVRDKESFLPNERKLLKLVKTSMVCFALGDRETGINQAIKAVSFMKAHSGDFPTFMDSLTAADLTLEHSDSPIFSMF